MSQNAWEADKMLDVYIYDYLSKRGLHQSAKAFMAEAKVPSDPVAINAPGGFLFEWWSVFWDIFIARTNEKHSEVAASYIETQQLKARELQQHQAAQQQQLDNSLKQNSLNLSPAMTLTLNQTLNHQNSQGMRSNPSISPNLGGNPNLTQNQNQNLSFAQNLSPNLGQHQSSALNSHLTSAQQHQLQLQHLQLQLQRQQQQQQQQQQRSRDANGLTTDMANKFFEDKMRAQMPPGRADSGGGSMEDPGLKRQMLRSQHNQVASPGVSQDSKGDVSSMRGPRGGDAAALFSLASKSQFGAVTAAQLQQLKGWSTHRPSLFPTAHHYAQFQSLTPSQQNQVLASQDLQDRKLKLQLNTRAMQGGGRGGGMARSLSTTSDHEMVLKGQSRMAVDGFEGLEGGSPNGVGKKGVPKPATSARKRKNSAASCLPANSTGTTNTGGPSSNPPTPSAQDPGDVDSGPQQRVGMLVPSASMTGKAALAGNVFQDSVVEETAVESYLSPEEEGHPMKALDADGFSFNESGWLRGHSNKVVCCHFSQDGSMLASGGHDKRAHIWGMNRQLKASLDEHSHYVTDVRFSAASQRLATSSFDKTIKIWDAENPYSSLRTLSGHSTAVTSVDFHPLNEDMVASCDADSEVKMWSVNQGTCTQMFKGATTQIRFHPKHGRSLATAADKVVTLFDVESCTPVMALQMHTKPVQSLCWDASGEFVASVSEDSVRVWSVGAGKEGECVHDLISSGNKFHSAAFHPSYPSLLVIGGYQTLELWNMVENKSMTVAAHDGLVAALATAPVTGMVASGSHDKTIKLWM